MASSASQWTSHSRLYKIRGAQYCNKNRTTIFRFYAPDAKNVWVILTSFGREEHKLNMEKNDKGLWEALTHLAQPGRTYLYLVNDHYGGQMFCIDPVSFSVLYIPEVYKVQSVVDDQTAFQWNDQDWMRSRAHDNRLRSRLSIYEIRLKACQSREYQPLDFRELAPELVEYCHKMSFTHIQMYGLLQRGFAFSGPEAPNFFAPHHGNGTCDNLKYLVDHLHQNGIGLIIDWIPINFETWHDSYTSQRYPLRGDGTHLYNNDSSSWGNTIFFDFSHEETRRLFSASALYYLDELHVDGIRFDAIQPIIRRRCDYSLTLITFLRQLNEVIHRCYPGVLTITATTKQHANLTKNMGFDLKWHVAWSDNTTNLLRTPYAERSHHWKDKVLDMLHFARYDDDKMILTLGQNNASSRENESENVLLKYVAHAQSDLERFSDLRNFVAWQILAPNHGYMIQMGDEAVQPNCWYGRSHRNLFSIDCSMTNSASLHDRLQQCTRDLNNLSRRYPQLWQEQDFMMIYEYGPNLVVAYHRGIHAKRRMAVIHNFSNRGYKSYDIPLPSWDPNVARIQNTVEIFNTDHSKYGGSDSFQNQTVEVVQYAGGTKAFRLSIPPLATLVLEEYLVE